MKAKLAILTLVGLVACSSALAQTNPAEGTSAGEATAPAAVQPGTVIPLIQFQELPLTTAIENLARQAGINYILDPKVGFGQPDEKTGIVKVQPNMSLRWEKTSRPPWLRATDFQMYWSGVQKRKPSRNAHLHPR